MKICAISDMHGNLDFHIEKSDLLVICGDITPLAVQSYISSTNKWFKKKFFPWLEIQSERVDKVLVIGGNHDMSLFVDPKPFIDLCNELNEKLGKDFVTYLNCEEYIYKGYRIYGTPMCKIFGHWYFMYEESEQDDVYNKYIEEKINNNEKVDIVISHDAPYGVSDVCLDMQVPWARTSEHIGNKAFERFISKLQPKYLFHGHLHSTNHECEKLGETNVYNVSLLDELYQLNYKPLYIEI